MQKELETRIEESKRVMSLVPKCKPFYLLRDIDGIKVDGLKCEGIEYSNCDQRLFYLEECFCKKAINENSKTKEIYQQFLKLEGW